MGDQRLQQLRNVGPGSVNLSTFNYTYDAEGQIQTWGQALGAAPAASYALGYDFAGQLTSAALSGATPRTFGYGYDPAGNRTNETINAAAAPVTVNALNQLVSRTGANPRAFAYDANGNMVSNNGVGRTATNYTYQWDAENRLVAILYPTTNQRTEFAYDGLGRRIRITERTGGTINSVRQFVWDGLSIAEERDSTGNLTKRFYSQGQVNGATPLFYTRDHLGSVREVANGAGTLQGRYDYDPYGRRTITAGADVADFGFTGHLYHTQSKLHLTLFRAYDAELGRWGSRDPIHEHGGFNMFAYVNGDPVGRVDILGLVDYRQTAIGGFRVLGGTAAIVSVAFAAAPSAGAALVVFPAAVLQVGQGLADINAGLRDQPSPQLPSNYVSATCQIVAGDVGAAFGDVIFAGISLSGNGLLRMSPNASTTDLLDLIGAINSLAIVELPELARQVQMSQQNNQPRPVKLP
ncbi:MAG: RHS repeat-associated core domain-containing protein [Bryobacterales bacterium]|nr:RHS repeat-associated core domain-containing protein [Bryobacterales bacterium]